MLKKIHGLSILGILILFVQELQEQLLIMLPLGNIGWSFFPEKISVVHVAIILLNLGSISFMSTEGITSIGIQEKTWLVTSFFFWSLTVGHLCLKIPLYNLHKCITLYKLRICFIPLYLFSFLFAFFFHLFLLFSFYFSPYVVLLSYT